MAHKSPNAHTIVRTSYIKTNGAVLLNLAQLKSTNQHFKFFTETLASSQLKFLMQASENVVCIHCTDNDMSMKRCSNYSVLRRTNQDQGFGYAVLQTLNSSDSENLRSLVPKLLNENMFLCIGLFPCPILRLPHSQS